MKVTYVLGSNWGGIPHYTAELANAVSNYSEVTVIKPKDVNNNLFSRNVNIINAFRPINFSTYELENISLRHILQNIRALLSYRDIHIVEKTKPDVIHFIELYPHVAFFAYIKRIVSRYPTICTLHDVPETILSTIMKYKGTGKIISFLSIIMVKLMLSSLERIIVHTQSHREVLVQKHSCIPQKVVVIPHGSYTFFKKYTKNEINNNENCVLNFGYIGENKGIEYLVKAIPIVSQVISDIKVIIAGEGDFLKYSKLIEDSSKFEIYNEFIPNEKVPELFQRAKIVVLPYTYHRGHSGVLNIAFAFGKPAIVTNVGSLPEMVEYGKSGLIVPPKDPEALAEAIIKLLEDDELRKKMSRNALKRAEELSWDNIAKMYIKVYEEVLDERSKRNKD